MQSARCFCHFGWLLLLLHAVVHATSAQHHTSNYALIVSSSRYWFNYRHNANALTIYKILKEKGFDDKNIILMLADEYAANSRNPFKNRIYTAGVKGPSLIDENLEIDYRGDDVNVRNFVNVLTGHQVDGLPILDSNSESNVLIYLTGHGGDQFFKFQDVEEVMADQLAAVFQYMHIAGKYNEILFIADTCQAFTLGDSFNSPNITVIGSSLRGESSYAHHSDYDVGLSVIERYTYALEQFLRGKRMNWKISTIKEAMIDPYSFEQQKATISIRDQLAVRNASVAKVADFFVNRQVPKKTVKASLVNTATPRLNFRPAPVMESSELHPKETPNQTHDISHIFADDVGAGFGGLNPNDVLFFVPLTLFFGLATWAGRKW